MLSQTDAVKQAWAAADRTLDIIVTVDGKDYQATEINSLNYDAGAFTGDTLGIGSTYENSVTIEFSSVVEAFKQGLTVLPKVGILVNGKFEYTKLGTFIMSEVNRDRNNNLTTIKALDQMCKLEGQYKPTVSATASPLDIIADIANQGGVAVNTGELQHLPALPNVKKIERQTLRTAIGWIAQLYDGFAAFDRDGKLTIRTTATPDYTITPGEYQQGGLTKNEVAYKTGGIKITVNTKKTDDSGQEVDDTTTLQAGETTGSQIELTNDSMTSDLLTTVWTGIKDITYYPYTLNWFGNPNLEAGDWVTLTDTQGNQFNVPVNQYTMSFNGGLESTISATQSSSTAGGYAYTGSAGSIKNMIEALQVRHTASGNNVYPPSYQGQPKNPKKGDVWYKQNGNNIEVWIYQEDDGKLSWVRTPLDGEVKAELQAMGKKTDEDLTRTKSELSSTAESQWASAKTATSETDQRLTSLQAEQNASLADLHNTADSLHAAANSLHADADSMRASMAEVASGLGKDITATRESLTAARNSLAAVDSSMRTATSEVADNLNSVKNSLAAVDADLRNGVKQAGNDLSAAKTSLAATGNSLATATSELQRNTGQLSGSLSTADSMIMFNSNAIAEVKRTAGEISTTVSNIRVGGRNLLRNSDKLPYSENRYSFWSTGQWRIAGSAVDADNMKRTNKEITDPPQGDKVTGISFTGILQPSVSDISLVAIDGIPVSGNVTVSFWARQTSNVDTAFVSANWGRERPAKVVNTNASTEIWGTASYPYRKLFLPKDGSWTRFWATFNVNDKDAAFIGAGNTGASAEVQICLVKIETGTMATDWTPAPEDTDQAISKVSQTADAIRADLTNTKGDISSLQQTANGLQSSVTNAQGEISNVKQTASKLQSDLANAKGDISSLQQTANGLTSRVGNAEGNISQLQQTANGLTSTVAAIGHNNESLVKTTTFMNGIGEWNGLNAQDAIYVTNVSDVPNNLYTKALHSSSRDTVATKDFIPVTPGDKYRVEIYFNSHGFNCGFGVHTPTSSYSWVRLVDIASTETGWVKKAVTWTVPDNVTQAMAWVQLDYDYSNTPPNNRPNVWIAYASFTKVDSVFDASISQIQQTADRIQSQVNDNKGNISTVTQTANAVKADLANTKGDVASVKAKADSLTTQLSDANGNISQLQQTAKGLQSTAADQSGKISTLQHNADGLNFTVANGSQNLILNSGNPSTTEHWWFPRGTLTLQKHSFWKNGTENLFVLTNTSSTDATSLASDYFEIEPNQTYTLSYYAFSDSFVKDTDVYYSPRKAGSNNVADTLIQLANGIKYSTSNAQYNKITFNSGDYNEGYIKFFNNASTTEGTPAELWLTDIQLEKGSIATAWHPSPGDIAQLKITADGLTSKVADTEGNVSNLQQTAQGLQTQVTNTKNDVSSLQVKADGIRTDLTNAKNDIASVKVKADSLTSSMANANNQISTLQQRADSITSTLSNGGVNLLNNSQGNFQPKNSVISNWQIFQGVDVYMTQGKKYTVSAQSAPGFVFSDIDDRRVESNRITLWLTDVKNPSFWRKISSDTTDFSQGGTHFTWNDASGIYILCVNSYKKDNSGYAHHVQIEYGETATPWQPSNGDISSLQQTTQGLTADMKDAKGNISSLQVTAGGLNTRVTNAEHNVSSVQETADRLSGVVGDANSGLVSSVNAIPGQISSAITASKQATVITSAVDLHNMTTAGYYLLKGALTNSPVDAWAFLRVITSDSGDRIYHRIWKDNASTVYTEEWTGSWSGWATHINSDNLKSNVITAINQSTEGVSITGNKITLDGNVNVAPGFTLSADRITTGTMTADHIYGGTLNFSNITVNGLTANSISSGSISGQNLNINLDNGVVEFTKGNLHSTDGGFNISIDTKSFYLDMGNDTKLWIDGNGYHLQESATQHLWMNKDGLHNYTDANGNGLWINDTELRILNSKNAGLVAKDGMLQFSANPTWNSPNIYSGSLNSQTYGTIGFNSNLLSSSLNGIFIKGREGVVIGSNSYDGGSLFGADSFLDVGQAGSGINLPDDLNKPASMFTKSALTLLGGPTYPASWGMSDKARISIGCDTYYSHSGASMYSGGNNARGNNISINARNTNIIGYDWVNIKCRNGRVALDGQYVHSYPTYNKTTSAGANVYVADDGALVRSSSARKYKTDIQDTDNDYGNKLIEFAPQKWIDKAEKKRYEEDPENNKKPGYYYGLIADDLDAAGLDMLVNYGAEGEVEGINYDRLAVALLPVIKSLKDQVASLKKQIKALTK